MTNIWYLLYMFIFRYELIIFRFMYFILYILNSRIYKYIDIKHNNILLKTKAI